VNSDRIRHLIDRLSPEDRAAMLSGHACRLDDDRFKPPPARPLRRDGASKPRNWNVHGIFCYCFLHGGGDLVYAAWQTAWFAGRDYGRTTPTATSGRG
jgi:hypothetical protein